MVKKYTAEIVGINQPIKDIFSIKIRSLSGSFKYTPGQFLHLALDEYDPSKAWPESRCFSIQSNPSEEIIRITYAVKGRFTERMAKELKIGRQVTLKMPYGDLFTQDHCKENTVFIAGGTGITPFISLFTHSSFTGYSNPRIYLGFRSREHFIYKEELSIVTNVMCTNPSITYFFESENGPINIAKILSESTHNSSFFISGPPAMIKNFKTYLIQNRIADYQIKTDNWE